MYSVKVGCFPPPSGAAQGARDVSNLATGSDGCVYNSIPAHLSGDRSQRKAQAGLCTITSGADGAFQKRKGAAA